MSVRDPLTRDALTPRQAELLRFIERRIATDGYPPTLREIGRFMGITSTNGVVDHLKALEKKGYLRRETMKSRAMQPIHLDEPPPVAAPRPPPTPLEEAHAEIRRLARRVGELMLLLGEHGIALPEKKH